MKLDDVEKAVGEILRFRADLLGKMNDLVRTLTEQGVQIAKLQVSALNISYTGNLANSIEGVFDPASGVGIIKAGAPYAVYVEYGTGIIGKNNPHPTEPWAYDVSQHGYRGWNFKARDGEWYRTRGQPSRPFMYYTSVELERICGRVAREVFGRD